MQHLGRSPTLLALTIAAGALVAGATVVDAAQTRKPPAEIIALDTPFGVYGTNGATPTVRISFVLQRGRRNRAKVEMQYGTDIDGNGLIEDDEYRNATRDKRDPRHTGRKKSGKVFDAKGDPGLRHTYVWDTRADTDGQRFRTPQLMYTPAGRPIIDPADPENYLVDSGELGVVLRARATAGRGRRKRASEWVYTDSFSLDNSADQLGTVSIDSQVTDERGENEFDDVVHIGWTGTDADSEDLNGNGVLDSADGEDANFNGVLDTERAGVTFDYVRLEPGQEEEVSDWREIELRRLDWQPCTKSRDVGDADGDLVVQSYGSPYSFAWRATFDERERDGQYILRARLFDGAHTHGEYTYLTAPFEPFTTQAD